MIYQTFKRTAKKYPNKVALICGDKSYTYSALVKSIDGLIAVLSTAVMPGERILFASDRWHNYVRMVLACDALGVTFMPTYYDLPKAVIDTIVNVSNPDHIILNEQDAEAMKPHNKGLVCVKRKQYTYTVLFTSGTTGEPKAVSHSNNACYDACTQNIDLYNMNADDVILAQLPPPTIAGLYLYPLPALMCGATVVMEAFNPRRYADLNIEHKPTVGIIVPAMIVAMSKVRSWHNLDMSHWRELSVGSTVIPEEMLQLLFDKGVPVIRDLYGCTETHVPPFTYLIKPDTKHKLQLECTPNYKYRLDRYGMMWIKGTPLMTGYLNADAEFDELGYWCTGDVFEVQHNKLFYKSRAKDLIKVNSYNVSPVSIENAIMVFPNIEEVCVTFRSRDLGECEIVALINCSEEINISELKISIKDKLFPYEIPKEIIIIHEPLVRNRMGKIQREQNREKYVT
jgi:acyl-coenzyme A synthetase/AMP-(fatty) acid ligase